MVQLNTQGTDPNAVGTGFSKPCLCQFVVESVEDHSGDANFPRIEVTVVSVTAAPAPGATGQNANVQDQVGKKRTEKFPLTPPRGSDKNPIGKFLHFCCAVGIYNKPQWEADTKAGVNPVINEQDAVGRSFCAPISMKEFYVAGAEKKIEKYKATGDTVNLQKAQEELDKNRGKSFPSLGGDWNDIFWAVGDAEADNIPLDADYLQVPLSGPLPTKSGVPRLRGSVAAPPAGNTKAAPVNTPAPPAGSAASSLF